MAALSLPILYLVVNHEDIMTLQGGKVIKSIRSLMRADVTDKKWEIMPEDTAFRPNPETHEFTSTQTCDKAVDFAFV
ncbi:hypothetical protein EB796_005313 [Bugula neritina]|uniref:Uncharacterized protein n=1 Tax=Bugula neritina TaxID=10212 RepID=A0A7J7KET9_BUGNE|nr:hypothetical protein EB796_005313 [Bugula neritina]